jgi:hypothetical protein
LLRPRLEKITCEVARSVQGIVIIEEACAGVNAAGWPGIVRAGGLVCGASEQSRGEFEP